jgi:hypothetical protein
MNRPNGVTFTACLMAFLSLAGWTVIDWSKFRPHHDTRTGLAVFAAFVLAVVTIKISALICVWYYWQGRNWARIAVLITSVWTVLHLLSVVHNNRWHPGIVSYTIITIEALLGLFFLYWLNTAEIRSFFETAQSRVNS